MKKFKLLGLIVFVLCMFGVSADMVKACSGDDCDSMDWAHDVAGGGAGGTTGGSCFRNSLCGNSNHITVQVDFARMTTSGDSVLATIQYTNNPSIANGSTIIYEPSLTKVAYDYGTAAQQINNMLAANNAAMAKQVLTNLGVTDFSGIHGTDAFGAKIQPVVQYKGADGKMHTATMKEYAAIATNKTRILDFLSRVTTGSDDILRYVNGMTPAECKAAGLGVAASGSTGCGMNILD